LTVTLAVVVRPSLEVAVTVYACVRGVEVSR
jgi:hypothetical protein